MSCNNGLLYLQNVKFLMLDPGVLGCDTASLGEWFSTFRRNAVPSSLGVKRSLLITP
jgi:hypothetical protein